MHTKTILGPSVATLLWASVAVLSSPVVTLADGGVASPEVQSSQPDSNALGQLGSFLERSTKIQGSERLRWEAPQSDAFIDGGGDSYLLTRTRLSLQFQPLSWTRFFVEGQDSRALGYNGTAPGSIANPADLRQLYVEIGSAEKYGMSVRFGRQEVQFGAGRLISVGDWTNVTKTFDVARGSFQKNGYRADVIAGSVVAIDTTRFDRHKPGEHIYGVYTGMDRLVPHTVIEPYFFTKTLTTAKGEIGPAGDSDEYVGGVRVAGKLPRSTTWSIEQVLERGGFGADNISANALTASFGTLIPRMPWQARAIADYNYASGDRSATDGKRGTFDFLYGLNNPFFSLTGMVGWKNLAEVRTGVEVSPVRPLKINVSYRDISLATTSDGFYNSTGTRVVLNRRATSGHVGNAIETQALYTLNPKTAFGIGLGKLFSGAYLRQSGKAGGYLYPYLSLSRSL